MKVVIRSLFTAICVASVTPAIAQDDALKKALSGKSLLAPNAQLKLARNGKLSGAVGKDLKVALEGAWTVRDGKFCRTLELPAHLVGTECQKAVLNADGTVTIDGVRGPVIYQIK